MIRKKFPLLCTMEASLSPSLHTVGSIVHLWVLIWNKDGKMAGKWRENGGKMADQKYSNGKFNLWNQIGNFLEITDKSSNNFGKKCDRGRCDTSFGATMQEFEEKSPKLETENLSLQKNNNNNLPQKENSPKTGNYQK